jgi:hypothetical protein
VNAQLKRRAFITLLGGAAAWPLGARAQQQPMPVIGFMSARAPEDSAHLLAAFRRGLAEGGYVEGQNVSVEFRWARGQYNPMREVRDFQAIFCRRRHQRGPKATRIRLPRTTADSFHPLSL